MSELHTYDHASNNGTNHVSILAIVFASDGFVKVTGYSRKEIIPRNCRFLQGQSTHQASVRRLRKRIEKKEESVELLLNYKKNGEPFWNLLYTTPLRDNHGKVIFFLGGQINCSTTIHSSSDVLKILAQSKDSTEHNPQRAQSPQATKAPPGRRLLNAFRSNVPTVEPKAPGMEDGLLEKIENLPWAKQADTFYTAYSNVSLLPLAESDLLTHKFLVHRHQLQHVLDLLHIGWSSRSPVPHQNSR